MSTKKRHFKVKNFKKLGRGHSFLVKPSQCVTPSWPPIQHFGFTCFSKHIQRCQFYASFFCNPSSQVFFKFHFTFVRILEFKHYNANSRVSGRDLISHLTARFEQRRDRKQNQRIFMAEHLLVAWHSRRTLVYVKPF